jgi:hypothetical protein
MTNVEQYECGQNGDAAEPSCECIWICDRGRTRLCCQMRRQGDRTFQIEVLRNSRVYGTYHFVARTPAVLFADRLRHSFEGNGWVSA